MPNYAQFASDLEALCRRHGIALVPTVCGGIGAWNSDRMPAKIMDCLEPGEGEPARAAPRPLPIVFDSLAAARAHPDVRYARATMDLASATLFAGMLDRTSVIPVGLRGDPDCWVIARPHEPD